MKKTTRIRTGMYSVLSLFVACLLLACLYGWISARTSAQQIRDLDSLTMEQLDRVNNAATWISRASANSHTAMLDRVNGDAAKAEKGVKLALERLDIARKLITDMQANVRDPKLVSQIEAMLKAFDAYKAIVEGQIAACRAGDLPGYIRISDGAKGAVRPSPTPARPLPTRSPAVSTPRSPPPTAACPRPRSAVCCWSA